MVSIFQFNVVLEDRGGKPLASRRAQRLKKHTERDTLRKYVQENDKPLKINSNETDDLEGWSQDRGRGRTGLIPNTILEEEDSSEHEF